MRINRFLAIVLLPIIIYSNQLTISKPVPVCGTPYTWGKIPEIVITKKLSKPTAGDTTFYIREDIHAPIATMIEVPFYKIKEADGITVYAEAPELDAGRVTQADVDKLIEALVDKTPPSSVNPGKGIIANEIEIFGQIPDVDNNQTLFVLLIDVRDGYNADESSETYVAGYFDPLDQINQSGKGNFGDIIYIDTNPAKVYDEATLGVVAHELQHLIHYGADRDEDIWLNEGLSELAPIILGFDSHSFSLFLRNTNRSLNSFDNSLIDYSKVGLWTYYCYRRFGAAFIHDIVQEKSNSLDSYEKVMTNRGFTTTKEELMQDWFIANLVNNPDIADGIYGYGGENIPMVLSDHFYGNFAQDQRVSVELNSAAAEYIKFYAGRDIRFDLNFDVNPQFHLAVVRQGDEDRIDLVPLNSAPYYFEDPDFGISYNAITFIPYWTKITTQNSILKFDYSAQGVGGIAETEIVYDDTAEFYIRLNGATAAERFTLPDQSSRLAGVKFNVSKNSPVTIQVLPSLTQNPIATYEVIPNQSDWTRYYFPTPVSNISSFFISLSSADDQQSLAYANTGQGMGRAYLKTGSTFNELSDYQVGDDFLTGDWLIGAIIHQDITSCPELFIEPAVLFFWNDEYTKSFEIQNRGSETMNWQITSQIPVWLTINPTEGTNLTAHQLVSVSVNRNLLEPGIYDHIIRIQSNGGSDSVRISVLERNENYPQAAIFSDDMIFSDQVIKKTLRVINIGIGEAGFCFHSNDPQIAFMPEQGAVRLTDTASVDVFIDPENRYSTSIPFTFYNGIDSLNMNFQYQGTITDSLDQLKIFSTIPNPFLTSGGQTAAIRIRLFDDSKPSLQVYNILGQKIADLNIPDSHPGLHVIQWNGKNDHGQRVSSGVYFLVLQQKNKISKQKILLLN
ncbi:MAG TPA: hypothetical protein DHW42_09795 [Candidatus Marinimicrobia bacterium]|nr:hypothetical protein [Candidatus Neomarinimicrobiota bacterium]